MVEAYFIQHTAYGVAWTPNCIFFSDSEGDRIRVNKNYFSKLYLRFHAKYHLILYCSNVTTVNIPILVCSFMQANNNNMFQTYMQLSKPTLKSAEVTNRCMISRYREGLRSQLSWATWGYQWQLGETNRKQILLNFLTTNDKQNVVGMLNIRTPHPKTPT